MAVGTVTKYNGFEEAIFKNAGRQWDNPTAGNIMFCLCDNTYTPSASHSTVANLTGRITTISGGTVNPAATGLAIDTTTTPGTTYYDSDDVNFGSSVTVTAKYLVCVQPVTANTFATTAKLLWYVDLDTSSSSAQASSTGSPFTVYTPTGGWVKTV